MPGLALVLFVIWFVSLFVVRSVVQYARTGSTGFKGFHGRPGSLPWFAGVATSAGLVLAWASPVFMLLGWPGGAALHTEAELHAAGAALVFGGTLGTLAAQLSMGDSWRIGVDESEQTQLVTKGLFAWVRNPIFSFMWLSVLGLLLMVPNAIALVGGVVTVLGIELQVRAVEEPYLARVHGVAYGDYANRVGRFFPGLGRLGAPSSRPPRAQHAGG